jgi:thiol-disulfide isomerase/thioredoxin
VNRTALVTVLSLGFAVVPTFVGCNKPENTPATALKNISVLEIDPHGLEKVVENHRGKVVLVDYWATWCPLCLELFPHTVKLRQRYSPETLAVITVSLDKRDDRGKVLAFLRRYRADTENYLSNLENDGENFDAFDIEAGLPNVRVYDRSGNLQGIVVGNHPDEIDRLLDKTLQ